MVAINFPETPGDGQIFTAANGNVYVFESSPDPGLWIAQVTIPGGSQSIVKLYSEAIAPGGTNQLLVTVPPGVKMFELEWLALSPTQKEMGLTTYVGGAPVGDAGAHKLQSLYGTGTTVTAQAGAGTFWPMGTGIWNHGVLRGAVHGGELMMDGHSQLVVAGTFAQAVMNWSNLCAMPAGGLSGFKVGFSDVSNFNAGSFARLTAVW